VLIFCVVSFSEFSGELYSLTVFIFTADYGKTCRGRGHIVSPHAQLDVLLSLLQLVGLWYAVNGVSSELRCVLFTLRT